MDIHASVAVLRGMATSDLEKGCWGVITGLPGVTLFPPFEFGSCISLLPSSSECVLPPLMLLPVLVLRARTGRRSALFRFRFFGAKGWRGKL
eukprot:1422059-Rhodomonas_salina.1